MGLTEVRDVVPKPLLLLTTPHTSCEWLEAAIAASTSMVLEPEYLNPLHNARHEAALSEVFGSPLISGYEYICSEATPLALSTIHKTWGKELFSTFTTSAYNPFKLATFVDAFNVVVVTTTNPQRMFGAGNPEVLIEYERFWWSLRERAHYPDEAESPVFRRDGSHKLVANSLSARAIEAHYIVTTEMRREAELLGTAVIDYDDLMGDPTALRRLVARTAIPNAAAVVDAICDYRGNEQ